MATDDDGKWHLDKKIPIGLMIGLTMNALFGVWYASKLDSRVTYLENSQIQSVTAFDKIKDTSDKNGDRLTRVEDQSESILEIVRRLENRKDPFPPEQPHNGERPEH